MLPLVYSNKIDSSFFMFRPNSVQFFVCSGRSLANFVHNFVHNFVRLKWQIVKLRSRSCKGQVRVRRVRLGHELYNIFNTAHQVLMFGCVSPNLKIQLTECSRMFQNVPECMQNVQECYRMYVECFRMLQNIPECIKNVQE